MTSDDVDDLVMKKLLAIIIFLSYSSGEEVLVPFGFRNRGLPRKVCPRGILQLCPFILQLCDGSSCIISTFCVMRPNSNTICFIGLLFRLEPAAKS